MSRAGRRRMRNVRKVSGSREFSGNKLVTCSESYEFLGRIIRWMFSPSCFHSHSTLQREENFPSNSRRRWRTCYAIDKNVFHVDESFLPPRTTVRTCSLARRRAARWRGIICCNFSSNLPRIAAIFALRSRFFLTFLPSKARLREWNREGKD